MILGHYFNWEYANLGFSANFIYPFVVVYKPISNKIIDRLFKYTRSRFETKLVSSLNYRTEFGPLSRHRYILALVGDQNPADTNTSYWADFFGKKAPIVKGPERGARLNKAAVVMCKFYKIKRGFYRSELELLTTEPRSLAKGEITKRMLAHIEETVTQHPSNYLWSHRRWKWEYVPEKHAALLILVFFFWCQHKHLWHLRCHARLYALFFIGQAWQPILSVMKYCTLVLIVHHLAILKVIALRLIQ